MSKFRDKKIFKQKIMFWILITLWGIFILGPSWPIHISTAVWADIFPGKLFPSPFCFFSCTTTNSVNPILTLLKKFINLNNLFSLHSSLRSLWRQYVCPLLSSFDRFNTFFSFLFFFFSILRDEVIFLDGLKSK